MAYDNNPQGQAEYDAMVANIAAAQNESGWAKSEMEQALARGDYGDASRGQQGGW